MFTQLIGGTTLAIFVMYALDNWFQSRDRTGPIAQRRAKSSEQQQSEQA